MCMGKKRRDASMFDVFRMRPRGRKGPKVIAYRDKKGRFIEIMKIDKDVKGLRARKKK